MNKRLSIVISAVVLTLLITLFSSCLVLDEMQRPAQATAVPLPAPEVVELPPPPPVVEPIATASPQVVIDWSSNASAWSDQVGKRITITLGPNGSEGSVWGTGVYTDDSKIGSAAVHMGLITFEEGGQVTIEIREGLDAYEGSSAHGVTTSAYGPWDGSFVFIDRQGNVIQATAQSSSGMFIENSTWDTNATQWSEQIGQRYTLDFPPNGYAGPIWGTGIYTDDSSIGTAAVHAGLITFSSGGRVTIEMREGLQSYEGSYKNGVDSSAYDAWGASFVFVDN